MKIKDGARFTIAEEAVGSAGRVVSSNAGTRYANRAQPPLILFFIRVLVLFGV